MKRSVKRYLAMLLVMTLVLQQGSAMGALAGETEPTSETVAEKTTEAQAAESVKKADEKKEEPKQTETQATETQAPETKAEEKKASETQASEPKQEETKAPETQLPEDTKPEGTSPEDSQTETQMAEPESSIEKVTEQGTESEAMTEAPAETTEPASEPETEKETKAEKETEAESSKETEAGPTLLKAECGGVGVSVSAAPGVLKAGTTLEMVPTGKNQVYQAVLPLMDENTEIDKSNFLAYDITLKLDGQEVQPDGEVTVSFTNVPFAAGENEEIVVAHLMDAPAESSAANTISAFRAISGATSAEIASGLSMKTTHFSIYAVCVLKKHYKELQSEAEAETDPAKKAEKQSEADKYEKYETLEDENGKYQPQNSFSFEYVDENGEKQTFTSPAFDFHIFADSVDFNNHTNGNIAANHLDAHGQAFGTNQKTSGTYEKDGVQHTGDGLLEYNYFGEDVKNASGTIASGRTVLGSGVKWEVTSDDDVTLGEGSSASQDGNKIYQAEGESEGDAKTGENSDKYIDIIDELNRLKTLSKELAKKETSDGVSLTPAPDVKREGDVINQHIKIDVTDCTDTVNYLNVNAKDLLNGNSKPELDLIGVKDKTIVINVNMAGLTAEQLAQFRCLTPTIEGCTNGEDLVRQNCNVLWNFYYKDKDDTSPQTFDMSDSIYGTEGDKYLDLSGGDWFMGTVLAPGANVKYGAHNGSIIAQKAQSTGKESHNWRYTGQSASVMVRKVLSAPGDTGEKTFHFAVFLDEAGTIRDKNQFVKSVTVTAPDGMGTVTFSDLKAGQDYYIYETDASGKRITETAEGYFVSGGGLAHPNHEKSSVVEITNSKEEKKDGSLSVTKTVTGSQGDKTKDFEFTVKLEDETVNGKYGDMTFTDGVATFTLKHGETKTANGLPKDVKYTVTETDNNGYKVTKAGDTGTIRAGSTVTAKFTNDKSAGGLTVSKTVRGNAGDTAKEFTFTVTLSDKTISGAYGDMTFTNGVSTFKLKHGERKTATGLPTGITYTVTETDNEGYTVTKTGDTGTISDGVTAEAAFTNTKNDKFGSLSVSKTVTGNAGDQEKAFTFTVTLDDTTVDGTYGDMTFKNGVATFTLKHGETRTATDLPAGVGYAVEETDNEGYTVTKEDDTGTIPENDTAEAAFENNKIKKGDLKVSKKVAGEGADTEKLFHFTVTLSDNTITGTYGDMEFANGVATFTLKDSESKSATGIPAGVTYTVTETEANKGGYTTTVTGAEGEIKDGETASADFINKAATTKFSLEASKGMADPKTAVGNYEFEVADASGKVLATAKNDAAGKVVFADFVTYTLSDIDKTFTYTVKEKIPTTPNGTIYDKTVYTVTVSVTADGTTGAPKAEKTEVKKDGSTITPMDIKFVNDVTHLSILKVDESGKSLAGAKLVVKDKDGKAAAGPWTTDGKTHEITGLPVGSYVLSEVEAPAGYDVSADVPFEITGEEAAGAVKTVRMTDKKTPEENQNALTITKYVRVQGITSDIGVKDATFYAALFSDEARTKRVSSVKKIEFKNTTASSVTFDKLAAGTYYVSETDENGTPLNTGMMGGKVFRPEYPGSMQFTFEGRADTKVGEFTNVFREFPDNFYLAGQLTVTKKVLLNGEEGTSNDTFYARVFKDAGLTAPVDDQIMVLSMAGGSTTSATVTNLPIGDTPGSSMTYYVAETDVNGIPLDPSAVEFEISVDKSEIVLSGANPNGEVVITNSFTEEEESEFESEFESEEESETEVEKKTAPKTGDDTDYMRYLLLMAFSAGLCGVAIGQKRRKAKRVRK